MKGLAKGLGLKPENPPPPPFERSIGLPIFFRKSFDEELAANS